MAEAHLKPTPVDPAVAIVRLRESAEKRGVMSAQQMLSGLSSKAGLQELLKELDKHAVHIVVDGCEYRLIMSHIGCDGPMTLLSIARVALDVCVVPERKDADQVLVVLGLTRPPAFTEISALARSLQFMWMGKV